MVAFPCGWWEDNPLLSRVRYLREASKTTPYTGRGTLVKNSNISTPRQTVLSWIV